MASSPTSKCEDSFEETASGKEDDPTCNSSSSECGDSSCDFDEGASTEEEEPTSDSSGNLSGCEEEEIEETSISEDDQVDDETPPTPQENFNNADEKVTYISSILHVILFFNISGQFYNIIYLFFNRRITQHQTAILSTGSKVRETISLAK